MGMRKAFCSKQHDFSSGRSADDNHDDDNNNAVVYHIFIN